jgi:hypothetical protein
LGDEGQELGERGLECEEGLDGIAGAGVDGAYGGREVSGELAGVEGDLLGKGAEPERDRGWASWPVLRAFRFPGGAPAPRGPSSASRWERQWVWPRMAAVRSTALQPGAWQWVLLGFLGMMDSFGASVEQKFCFVKFVVEVGCRGLDEGRKTLRLALREILGGLRMGCTGKARSGMEPAGRCVMASAPSNSSDPMRGWPDSNVVLAYNLWESRANAAYWDCG